MARKAAAAGWLSFDAPADTRNDSPPPGHAPPVPIRAKRVHTAIVAPAILTVNAGSSSLRLSAFDGERCLATVRFEELVHGDGWTVDHFLARLGGFRPEAVVHRVVHGGPTGPGARPIDSALEAAIERFAPMAPLHNPPALAWLRACRTRLPPDVPQLAVFDTGFFSDLPEAAVAYALPRALAEREGLRRYGFHGIAHRSMWERWRQLGPTVEGGGRVVSFQLGAGCSAAALDRGRPIDTSMGFSPLEGLVMATRSGDVDPGLLLYLVRERGLAPASVERLLNEESGLLGLSGASGDLRVILARRGEPGAEGAAARLAVDVFCRRARKYLGAYAALLGGVDAVLFGGGVGEHQPEIRARILEGLSWAGLALVPEANAAAVGREARLTAEGSPIAAWVLPVDEERLLAQEAARWLAAHGSG